MEHRFRIHRDLLYGEMDQRPAVTKIRVQGLRTDGRTLGATSALPERFADDAGYDSFITLFLSLFPNYNGCVECGRCV
jgi:hypothetical protein